MSDDHSNIPGVLFIAFGALFLAASQSLNMGTLARMGPGYMPAALSGILIALGLVQIDWRVARWPAAARSLASRIRGSGDLRPLAMMSLGALAFYLLIERVGLAPSLGAAGFIATYCFQTPTLLARVLTALAIAVVLPLVFVQLLGLSVPVVAWPA
jgi:hypothetical protein